MLRRNIKIKLIMTKHSDDVKNGEICKVRQIPVSCRAQILKFSRSPEGEEEKGGKLSWNGGGGYQGSSHSFTINFICVVCEEIERERPDPSPSLTIECQRN